MKNTAVSITLLALVITFISFRFDLWHTNRIVIDAPSYYAWLPSAFIHNDLSLKYVDHNPEFFRDKIWFQTLPDGSRLIKSTYGMSAALSPFFFIGHFTAPILGFPQDGYSWPYQNAMTIGVLIYLFVGLYFLSKVLLNYFSDKAVALTIFTIVAGTNLLWYSTFEGLMNHAVSFSFLCICIYLWISWINEGNKKHLLLFVIMFTMVVLIRSLSVTLLLYFLIAGVLMKGGIKNFFSYLKAYQLTLFMCIAIALLMVAPQLWYWKKISGHWLADAYIDEHFYFLKPYFFSFLFSFRKGWFVYTPVIFVAASGMIVLYKKLCPVFYATLISVIVTAYIFSSWWAWSYGICWGMRPMIDSYSFMSFPLAAAFSFILERKKIIANALLSIIALLVMLNLFQTWQYKKGLIHFDDMTREAYFKGFFQTEKSEAWMMALRPFDWESRLKGKVPVEYTKQYIDTIAASHYIYLQGNNLGYVSASRQSDYSLTCNFPEVGDDELFRLIKLGGDTVALKSVNGKYLSIESELKDVAIADAPTISSCEKLVLIQTDNDYNRIALKACNNKYLAITQREPHIIFAVSDSIKLASTFRLFLYKAN